MTFDESYEIKSALYPRYIDSKGYLTDNYNPNFKLQLNKNIQGIEENIRNLLKKHYIQFYGEFLIKESLKFIYR